MNASVARTAGVASTSGRPGSSRTTYHLLLTNGHRQPRVARSAATAITAPSTDVQVAKQLLLTWIAGTKRGSQTTKQLRGQIEEAQVALEALSPAELDYSLLEVGTSPGLNNA